MVFFFFLCHYYVPQTEILPGWRSLRCVAPAARCLARTRVRWLWIPPGVSLRAPGGAEGAVTSGGRGRALVASFPKRSFASKGAPDRAVPRGAAVATRASLWEREGVVRGGGAAAVTRTHA